LLRPCLRRRRRRVVVFPGDDNSAFQHQIWFVTG
jgi:hypothetical protein